MPKFNTYSPADIHIANVLDMFHGDNREAMPDFVGLKAAGIVAILHKCSQGQNYIDPTYKDRVAAASAAGLCVGAYHFLDSSDVQKQADNFLAASNVANMPALALAADYEKTANTPSLQQLLEFMSIVDSVADRSTILYSSDLIRETLQPHPGGHMNARMVGHEDFFRKHRLWLAEYGPHLNVPYPWQSANTDKDKAPGVFLWQFSATGKEPGIVGALDLNFYGGDVSTLANNWVR